MRHTTNKSWLWILIVVAMLASLTACASSKKETYLPEKYLEWTVAEASITMEKSTVVKSEIIMTQEGNSISLEYENGQWKESKAISQKTTQLYGFELVGFLKSSGKELREITQSDTVLIGITGDQSFLEALTIGKEIYVYEISREVLRKAPYDGGGYVAWGSIMDGDYVQTHTLILR